MAYEEAEKTVTLPASGDLSSNQWQLVAVDSNGRVALAGDGAQVDGILYNKPDAQDKSAEVVVPGGGGIARVKAGAATTAGGRAASDGNGKAVDSTSGDMEFGTFLEAAGSGDEIVSVLLSTTVA